MGVVVTNSQSRIDQVESKLAKLGAQVKTLELDSIDTLVSINSLFEKLTVEKSKMIGFLERITKLEKVKSRVVKQRQHSTNVIA